MRKRISSISILVISVVLCGSAFPLGGDHPTGVPVRQNPEWPAGLTDLLNSGRRVNGYWVNANDWFFYAGDTEEFNEFIRGYAGLKETPLMLVLRSGQGLTGGLGDSTRTIKFDWQADVRRRGWSREAPPDPTGEKSKYVVLVELNTGGQVQLEKVQVPLNVKVKWGDAGKELVQFANEHEAKRQRAKGPKPAVNMEHNGTRLIDLDPYVTAPFEAFHGAASGSDLPLDRGVTRVDGTEFLIGRGVIQVRGSESEEMPSEVKGIKVGIKFKKLHILHGTSSDVAEGTRIGSYVIHYEDQSAIETPVQYGVHVKTWWFEGSNTAEVSGGKVAWTGGDSISPPVRLYIMTWENPYPNKVVIAVDCKSAGTQCTPFVVAMTAEMLSPETRPGEATETPASGEGPEATIPRRYKSERPQYARMALNKDDSKILFVVFDESNGTGSGYDVLYADVNFDGRFEEAEKRECNTLRHQGKVISSSFAPMDLSVPYDGNPGSLASWRAAFGYHAPSPRSPAAKSVWVSQPSSVPVGTFHVTAVLSVPAADSFWSYFVSGNVETSDKLETASVWRVCPATEFKVETRPDGRTEGNLGIALQLATGENDLLCKKDGGAVKARLEIKKPDGKVVHQGEETLDKFVFG